MAERPPELINQNQDRIARSSILIENHILPTHLVGIGYFQDGMYVLHTKADQSIIDTYESCYANLDGIVVNIRYLIEWKDTEKPNLFSGGFISSISKGNEIALLAIHISPFTKEYTDEYESLKLSKYLLDRTISINNFESMSRFKNLILE